VARREDTMEDWAAKQGDRHEGEVNLPPEVRQEMLALREEAVTVLARMASIVAGALGAGHADYRRITVDAGHIRIRFCDPANGCGCWEDPPGICYPC
jgi:hypothetical protein